MATSFNTYHSSEGTMSELVMQGSSFTGNTGCGNNIINNIIITSLQISFFVRVNINNHHHTSFHFSNTAPVLTISISVNGRHQQWNIIIVWWLVNIAAHTMVIIVITVIILRWSSQSMPSIRPLWGFVYVTEQCHHHFKVIIIRHYCNVIIITTVKWG